MLGTDSYAQSSKLFTELLRELFASLGFTIDKDFYDRPDFSMQREKLHLVEVKYYRTARAQMTLLCLAAATVVEIAESRGTARPLLVVSCFIDSEQRQFLKAADDLDVLDGNDLLYLVSSFPELQERLLALLEIAPDRISEVITQDAIIFKKQDDLGHARRKYTPRTRPLKGKRLAKRLNEIPVGKDGWQLYEKHCIEMLRFLFDGSLESWRTQQSSSDGMNRVDCVCRVLRTTEFWTLLYESLQSRYVVFEFKNYADSIQQGQILTTEKYLLEKALRKTAIILSRKGASKGAVQMAQGAMRDSGKLIITLSDNEIVEMLLMKDGGGDPSDYMFGLVDEFLLTLPR